MALFRRDFNKPGPGVPKNAPRKKGFARFFEILGRDFSNLVKLNLLYQLCILPAQLLMVLAVLPVFFESGGIVLIFAIAALVFCIPLGPATTALYNIITKMLRDEPGFVWHDFKKLFKENFKNTLVPGLIYGLILGAQIFAVLYYVMLGGQINWILMAVYFLSLLIFYMAVPYYFVQAGYLDLKNTGILKNSILLSLGFLPRSFMGALLNAGLIIAQIMFLPITVITLFIFGYTIPCLLNLMWVWPPINKQFQIEKTLVEKNGGEWIDPDPPPPPKPQPEPEDEEPEDTPASRYIEYEDYMKEELEEEGKPSDDDK